MARAVSEEMVCDICGTHSRVEAYTVVTKDGARVVDLCIGDAKPLVKLWEAGSDQPRRKTPGKSNRPEQHRVEPVD